MNDQQPEYEGDGVEEQHVERQSDGSDFLGQGVAVGDLRQQLVTSADLTQVKEVADEWGRLAEEFDGISDDLFQDMKSTIDAWEGDDAEEVRTRVEAIKNFGNELHKGIVHSEEIINYVHDNLKEAHNHALYPDDFPDGGGDDMCQVPFSTTGPGSRSLSEWEEQRFWVHQTDPQCEVGEVVARQMGYRDGGEFGGRFDGAFSDPCLCFGDCKAFSEWNENERYQAERNQMGEAVALAADTFSNAQQAWIEPVQPPEAMPTEETLDPGANDSGPSGPGGPGGPGPGGPGGPGGGGSGSGGGGGGGGTQPEPYEPETPEDPEIKEIDGKDENADINDEEGEPTKIYLPDGFEDFRDGEIAFLKDENGDKVLHPYAAVDISPEDWEQMAEEIPDEMWATWAEEKPGDIPRELSQFAPDNLMNQFPANDPEKVPQKDEHGHPIPRGVNIPQEAQTHMTRDMGHAITNYDKETGQQRWIDTHGVDPEAASKVGKEVDSGDHDRSLMGEVQPEPQRAGGGLGPKPPEWDEDDLDDV
ncbi:hypothetical protein [Haloglycomyces albus]|uniref:hypothetical protein n=1 Tax=Haloglycomyces albus TaxID=526067 RepID=UPI00046CF4C0|nr:hypothetical protein [Haloglycomyces albus]